MNITKRDVKYVVEQSHVLRMLGIWPLIDRRSNMIEKSYKYLPRDYLLSSSALRYGTGCFILHVCR